ncbi:AAA family ATPase [Chryseobacterium sp. Ch-15]|uniref:AAA family ATPase n=1 Tax=Chryseobacterium muglaense TaxID=2893752 RepID=A0A9Q3YRC1_9FLAO|nr:AAA family ATPase [Chryseobacterium muglaense]MBD3906508.1 AAA family ATPase [Chryseobacterium muglaense]MCC9034013.1 AAA family ATPase [Chryseobacterium muglaense]MCM2556216.1 AAA family ATPase [Chryseobacterium muglaense]
MNYWHIQLHPDNKLSSQTLKDILINKKVIGMGSYWEDKNNNEVPDPRYFKNDMKIGDVVMVRNGSTPIALVEVNGDAFGESNTIQDYDWFDLRRNINLLGFYEDSDKILLQQILKRYDKNHIQAPGTLTYCNGRNATNDFIKEWHKEIKFRNIMKNIILSDASKTQLNQLFNTFCQKYNDSDKIALDDNASIIVNEFQTYTDKIKIDSFTLDDYTNRQANDTGLPGSYLCNFLERRSRDLFGSSKPAGSALSFGIKADKNENSFTIDRKDPDNPNKDNRVEAETEFEKYKTFFKNVVSESEVFQQMKLIEDCNFIYAKQILRKFLVLSHPFQFIYAYNDRLDDLYQYFFGDDHSLSKIKKSFHINFAAKKILNIDDDSYATQIILSRFLWKLASSQSLFSKSNPNVILYGPPGTGKTYKIKQDLKFLTKGDSSRVKYVVFHPSYGYEDFIEGIKPCGVTENGNLKFELINGSFKEFCKLAKSRPNEEFYFVVDEINRANLSAVFGETLVSLESSYRDVVSNNFNDRHLFSTQYSSYQEHLEEKKKVELAYEISETGSVLFGVPDNLYFVGMMNNVDKNIDSFDLALRRRFKWIYFGCDYDVIENVKSKKGELYTNRLEYVDACRNLNEFISDAKYLGLGKSFEFGHSLYLKISTIEKQKHIQQKSMDQLFREFLLPTLNEYLRAYYDESEIEKKSEEAQNYFKL